MTLEQSFEKHFVMYLESNGFKLTEEEKDLLKRAIDDEAYELLSSRKHFAMNDRKSMRRIGSTMPVSSGALIGPHSECS